ncbi:hypothetical protein HETIRDRAFT_170846 [Heterobasidion irregulare TC 32-1]|uniref:Uncharacterized protein n=1 Tax=Heterobasidion irregulare (strain TC 32-1) TaxID=747525 RepID=W4KF57_HETIT|nr:uncharacterized protein HETIRDRAFT_170846 [Heterobasidion irregulare TC 32-1]ETW84349.1 hypothetical protein HETIRDRAFT_170846 [Heterobasidion irregulare TC 32-1]
MRTCGRASGWVSRGQRVSGSAGQSSGAGARAGAVRGQGWGSWSPAGYLR